MNRNRTRIGLALLFVTGILIYALNVPYAAAGNRLKLSSTTSTDNTGLLDYILPIFEDKYGIRVDVIAVGTGKALKLAENGDVDVTLVHAPALEKAFVDAGFGIDRRPVMANYFIIVGPKEDPAGIGSAPTAVEAFRKIARSGSPFISRGDGSGTHVKEKAIWIKALGKVPQAKPWYLESGRGMGGTLTMADEKRGYTLSDQGSYLKYADKVELVPDFHKRSPLLYNPYGIIAVNPEKHPDSNYDGATKLIEFMTSPEGQRLIGGFKDRFGNVIFVPIAGQQPPAAGNVTKPR
ncbi:MAG: solute-binding protein [Deltaproteobacteria bacterium]|nr:solute-binding protein [Deltaproteobacteria bacterium]